MSHVIAVRNAAAVAATTSYVLVDLSDITNFPHEGVQEIHLHGMLISAEKAADGEFDIAVGVLTENDGTDGSADWIHLWHMVASLNPTDSTDRLNEFIDFTLGGSSPEGANLAIVDGAPTKIITNARDTDNALWKNDVNRVSPAGSTTKPGVGDLVVLVTEVGGTGTIDFTISATYETF